MNTQETKAERKRHYRSELIRLLLSHPWTTVGLIAFSLGAALTEGVGVGLVVPLLESGDEPGSLSSLPIIGLFSQMLEKTPMTDRVRLIAIILVVIAIIRGVLSLASSVLSHVLPLTIECELRKSTFAKILGHDMRYLNQQQLGRLQTVMGTYTTQSGALVQNLAAMVMHFFIFVIYLGLMLLISVKLTAFALIAVGVVVLGVKARLMTLILRAAKQRNETAVDMVSFSLEVISGIKLVRLFTREAWSMDRFEKNLICYKGAALRAATLQSLIPPVFLTLTSILIALLLVISTYVFSGPSEAWLPTLVFFLLILFRLTLPALAINNLMGSASSFLHAFQELSDFLHTPETGVSMPALHDAAPVTLRTQISVDSVSFRYDESGPNVLNDLSFSIEKGEMVAIVGRSGVGKTTLINLLARLYDPTDGQIEVDGVDLKHIDPTGWRSRLGVVTQDTFLFNDTVAANLRFADHNADQSALEEAAKLACAHEFIEQLPEGYDTILGERGVRLSGGQQQRIAIARAILGRPEVMILDEATSHLDSGSEKAIQHAISNLREQCTLVVIAHRLSTIRQADCIVVLKDGYVAEKGTHDDLMKLDGEYHEMVCLQQHEADEEVPDSI